MRIFEIFYGLISTLILLPIWIGICGAVPYLIGLAINKLFLRGRELLSSMFGLLLGLGIFSFLPLFILLFGFSIIRIFNDSLSDWWYKTLFPFAAIGNTVSIGCFLFGGICGL